MRSTTRDGLVPGVVLGLVVAFVFALVIRYVPADWLLDPLPRAILYAVQVPAGLLFVPIASAVARARAESPRQVLLWACCGALAFDGLVLGFWPSLYGHAGPRRPWLRRCCFGRLHGLSLRPCSRRPTARPQRRSAHQASRNPRPWGPAP